jgi:hypothetical protein
MGRSGRGEGAEHWTTLRPLVETGRVAGPKIHDGRIAAVCLAHGVRALWTVDRDFSRFPTLRAVNPLASAEEYQAHAESQRRHPHAVVNLVARVHDDHVSFREAAHHLVL